MVLCSVSGRRACTLTATEGFKTDCCLDKQCLVVVHELMTHLLFHFGTLYNYKTILWGGMDGG